MLTQQVKFEWTPTHHTTFLNLKEAIVQAPIPCYPDPNKKYTDASDCMQSTTLKGTQWNGISCSVIVTHIHRLKEKMEHN